MGKYKKDITGLTEPPTHLPLAASACCNTVHMLLPSTLLLPRNAAMIRGFTRTAPCARHAACLPADSQLKAQHHLVVIDWPFTCQSLIVGLAWSVA